MECAGSPIDGRGHVREVDLFIATPGGLFLVEIKSHPGVAANNGSTWLFRDGSATRTIENPLHFTDLKCKELKSQLERAARDLRISEPVPRVEAVVFLSAQTLICRSMTSSARASSAAMTAPRPPPWAASGTTS